MEQVQHQAHFVLLVKEGQGVVAGVRVLHAEFAAVAYAPVGWLALVELTVLGVFKNNKKKKLILWSPNAIFPSSAYFDLQQSRTLVQDRFVQLDVLCIGDQTSLQEARISIGCLAVRIDPFPYHLVHQS
jgi:hypothetical protein